MKTFSNVQRMFVFVIASCSILCAIAATVSLAILDVRNASKQSTPVAIFTESSTSPANDFLTGPPSSTPIEALPTVMPSPGDPIWAHIEKSGRIVVGMTADHPPFSYIDENFNIQGYDLALITEVGRRLGYPLEIRNMGFENLFSALQLNEIDVAVAALPLNEARGGYVNFSIVYYVGEDAVIAHRDSEIVVERFEDLAGYRVGVQQGSVYETWMRDIFIEPGMMLPENLSLFGTPIEAAEALVRDEPNIDLVLMDSMPANIAERALDVKIIAHDLNPQLYALAVPSGAFHLQSKLNEAMLQMQHDGTLKALAKHYLSVENPMPITTPSPYKPGSNDVCIDSFSFVMELTYLGSNLNQIATFEPGITFQKGWRVRNTGTCIWDSSYVLAYVESIPPNAPIGGNAIAVQGLVFPGQTYDIYASLSTPLEAGIYESHWSLRNPLGIQFGDRLIAKFEVILDGTPFSVSALPKIFSFTVSPNQIDSGDCVDISWSFGGGDISMSRLFRNNDLILYDLPLMGTYEDCPPDSGQVEYIIIIDGRDSGSVMSTRYVYVSMTIEDTDIPTATQIATTVAPPVILSFSVSPKVIQLGECVQLSWHYSASRTAEARLYRDQYLLAIGLATNGTRQDCPTVVGRTEYRLVVTSPTSSSAEQTVTVLIHSNFP